MNMDLHGKRINVFGVHGSGKSNHVKFLLDDFDSPIMLRETPDYDDLDHITLVRRDPEKDRTEQLDDVAEILVQSGREVMDGERQKPEYDALVVEDAEMYWNSRHDFGEWFKELKESFRKMGISIIVVAHRPQDVPPDIRENATINFLYKMEGRNIEKLLRDIDKTLPEVMAQEISLDRHNFIIKELGKQPRVHKPLPVV